MSARRTTGTHTNYPRVGSAIVARACRVNSARCPSLAIICPRWRRRSGRAHHHLPVGAYSLGYLPSEQDLVRAARSLVRVTLPARGQHVQYGGIGVTNVFTRVRARGVRVQAVEPAPDRLPSDAMPAHVEVRFDGFARTLLGSSADLMPAVIRVYRTDQFARFGWTGQHSALARLLAHHALLATQTDLPFLPFLGAGQLLHARAVYLRFAGGTGLRYLTHYAQAVDPLTADSVFYTVQGLTADGRSYVSITFPLRTRFLPLTRPSIADESTFERDFSRYLAGITRRLTMADDTAFVPSLHQLDRLVQSLSIAPAAISR